MWNEWMNVEGKNNENQQIIAKYLISIVLLLQKIFIKTLMLIIL
jgi:hypothetical protein